MCGQMYVCVRVTGQLQVSFLRHCPPLFSYFLLFFCFFEAGSLADLEYTKKAD